jgi:hypothetical protein
VGIDNKYGQVIVPNSTIAEDEPVVVFRAQDKLLPAVLEAYRGLCQYAGSPEKYLELIVESREKVIAWQNEHFTQVPQSADHKG